MEDSSYRKGGNKGKKVAQSPPCEEVTATVFLVSSWARGVHELQKR